MRLLAGSEFAGYIVREHLGRGGMSEVYRVTNPTSGRTEALKVLEPDTTLDSAARARLQREFDIAHTLRHPSIVRMYSDGIGDEIPWITMQFVDGRDASTLVPPTGRMPDLDAVIDLLGQVADGLDYAHHMDVLHRDVKPSNILVGRDRRTAVLTDFGVAYLLDDSRPIARKGRVVSSIPYAAPELLQGQQLSPATDQYALACTTVEMLTGKPPYPRATPFGIAHAHVTATPPLLHERVPWLSPSVDEIIGKALAKDPARRYDSCAEFARSVSIAVEHSDDEGPGNTPVGFRRWLRSRMSQNL